MRSTFVGALACVAVACGGDDSGSATPYSGARSAMCGAAPSGVWNIELTSALRLREGQTDPMCDLQSALSWDYSKASFTNVYDEGCRVQCTIDNDLESDHVELMWVAADTWSGVLTIYGSKFGKVCMAEVDVTLTR